MKAMLCGCGQRLEASGDDALVGEALAHYKRTHGMAVVDGENVRRVVQENAYRLEYAAPYAGGAGPDEEFGPEPY